MNVLVVDDSAFMRKAITQMLQSDPQIHVLGQARNGREGVELAEQLRPDVITLDIEMPEMDGLTALRHIMQRCPTQVLMLSSLTTEGSRAALRAMSLGAADVLAKDASQVSLSATNLQEELIGKVKALAAAGRGAASPPRATAGSAENLPRLSSSQFDVVCIGSSTGGPPVLDTLLRGLPETFALPIVIAQHMPLLFTRSMAERLGEICRLRVVLAEDGMALEKRTIYVAPGGSQTHLHKIGLARWSLRVDDEPRDAPYRPSVDALFHSAAQTFGQRTLAIVLTGMGTDGLDGAKALHQRKATLLAQSAETCVVYGMPKAVTQAALVAASLSPAQFAQLLRQL